MHCYLSTAAVKMAAEESLRRFCVAGFNGHARLFIKSLFNTPSPSVCLILKRNHYCHSALKKHFLSSLPADGIEQKVKCCRQLRGFQHSLPTVPQQIKWIITSTADTVCVCFFDSGGKIQKDILTNSTVN